MKAIAPRQAMKTVFAPPEVCIELFKLSGWDDEIRMPAAWHCTATSAYLCGRRTPLENEVVVPAYTFGYVWLKLPKQVRHSALKDGQLADGSWCVGYWQLFYGDLPDAVVQTAIWLFQKGFLKRD